jgi:hypothetical protein
MMTFLCNQCYQIFPETLHTVYNALLRKKVVGSGSGRRVPAPDPDSYSHIVEHSCKKLL